ncbi:MAG: hypothetical protein A2V88_01490 [Elusimicrobia bacterium RBG_16_66_12]|nr:MAG: hypothetical protein A2V88_01490 [Elusimicrobia bacterium RBG_16_66_12]
MSPFAAVVTGGSAGFFGAALAHLLTTLADRLGAEGWLRGPYGPQFFPIALYTAVFYAAIGAAAGRRTGAALAGLLGPMLGIAGLLAGLTRYSGWGMPRGLPGTPQWQLAVTVVYGVSVWGTISVLGILAGRTARWRGALAAVIGSLCAYGSLALILAAVPSYGKNPWNPVSFIPSPVNLLDGLLSGVGLCLALSLDERIDRRPS